MFHDQLYANPREPVPAFCFDAQVAQVFPDMIRRSVPGYEMLTGLLGLVAEQYVQPGSRVYDLGCSLGAASLAIRARVPECRLIAVDNAAAMADRCRENLSQAPGATPVTVICDDIRAVPIKKASLVVLQFTLQFIPPPERLALLEKICHGLLPGGVLVLSEKLCFSSAEIQTQFTDLHHAFKRAHGYSELEISQKRSALENVLIPETLEQHQARLRQAGFAHGAVWFQCVNFASLLAWKSP